MPIDDNLLGRDEERLVDPRVLAAIVLVILPLAADFLPVVRVMGFSLLHIQSYLLVGAVVGYLLLAEIRWFLDGIGTPHVLFGGFFLYAGATVLWSAYPSESFHWYWYFLTSGLIGTAAILACRTERGVRYLLYTVQFLAIGCLIIAAWEFLTGNHLPASRLTLPEHSHRSGATAVFYNRNNLSMFLTLTVPFFLGLLLTDRRTWLNVSVTGLVVSIAAFCYYNESRAAVLAIVLMVPAMVVFWMARSRIAETVDRWHPIWTAAIGVLVLLVLMTVAVLPNPFSESGRFSLWVRWEMHATSVDMLLGRPQGYGLGTFSMVVEANGWEAGPISNPHSWIATLAGSLGVLGLVSFVAAYGLTVDGLFRAFVRSQSILPLTLFTSLGCFVLVGVNPSNALLMPQRSFWVIVAISLAYLSVRKRAGYFERL